MIFKERIVQFINSLHKPNITDNLQAKCLKEAREMVQLVKRLLHKHEDRNSDHQYTHIKAKWAYQHPGTQHLESRNRASLEHTTYSNH